MKQETRYLISDAAKKVQVESHVLRYWEEELKLPIKRNELGHRYYTEDDIFRFKEVKSLKEQGLQLKAIRMILKDGQLKPFSGREVAPKMDLYEAGTPGVFEKEEKEKHVLMVNSNELMNTQNTGTAVAAAGEAKTLRLQQLLKQMISDAVHSSTKEFVDEIKETMLKELDYQFRLQEEREENYIKEKIERDEAHYQRIDEMLRKRSRKLKPPGKEKKLFRK
ncbi:MAG: helix-turn-helix domain-containing protein [Lachnospiraceae bacterium]|nr:helix-turn-helix domain-containing protein [Lachnospiraceae bacterium]